MANSRLPPAQATGGVWRRVMVNALQQACHQRVLAQRVRALDDLYSHRQPVEASSRGAAWRAGDLQPSLGDPPEAEALGSLIPARCADGGLRKERGRKPGPQTTLGPSDGVWFRMIS